MRFRCLPSLAFPPSPVTQVRPPDAAAPGGLPPVEMVGAFLGLIGPSGVLPHHYTALCIRKNG